MVDNKPADPAPETKEVETDELQEAYEARSKAYSEGQEEIEAKRKEAAAPYEKLSKLVDEHAEKGAVTRKPSQTSKKK